MTAVDTSEVRVLVYERRRLVREGLAAFLGQDGAIVEVCDEPAQLDQRIRTEPDAVVIGIDGADDALWSALERSARRLQRLRSIAVVSEFDAVTARRARKLGILRVVTCESGLAGITEALRAEPWSRTPTRPRAVPGSSVDVMPLRLTSRELGVVRLISLGLTANQIAEELGITAKTVENHKQRIYRKLGVQSQSQAVGVALRRGLLQPVRSFAQPSEIG